MAFSRNGIRLDGTEQAPADAPRVMLRGGVTEFLHTRPLVAGTAYLVLLSMPLDTNVAYIAASESFVAP